MGQIKQIYRIVEPKDIQDLASQLNLIFSLLMERLDILDEKIQQLESAP